MFVALEEQNTHDSDLFFKIIWPLPGQNTKVTIPINRIFLINLPGEFYKSG